MQRGRDNDVHRKVYTWGGGRTGETGPLFSTHTPHQAHCSQVGYRRGCSEGRRDFLSLGNRPFEAAAPGGTQTLCGGSVSLSDVAVPGPIEPAACLLAEPV